ncbi:tetratricopeptide repeat protein [Cyclobacterium jeungdonense]|uniref:Molecular chaperone DnaJ n=1 Tax=Cyclobacterium jeungdonense TaxID=708087 RepID=A0ABT8CDR9_9BACT|nr:tetratricopeptide repeat protein [Cyclobacterium jeungdonense]MDN3690222.1 molecular chaperone DnaJ [Cyclobacterium jeungdonense]
MKIGWNNGKGFLVLLFLSLNFVTARAQHQPSLGSTARLMDRALAAMASEKYQDANAHFREIIASNLPIPPEMPYYFAETLYQLGQYHNSDNFVRKYLDLNGFEGEHYTNARALLEKLADPMAAIRSCEFCDSRGYRYQTCTTCHGEGHTEQPCSLCRGHGVIGCSRCAGDGLVTKKNVFNIVEYFECERCSGEGRLTCTQCNGSLVEQGVCATCGGSGTLESETICDHLQTE